MNRLLKILIANRGEIAVRVMRSAKALGYRTVAVYSDADTHALHARTADEAVRIGPAPAAESYLDIERIVEAAVRVMADAVHPGYGFLSENADFAQRCRDTGLAFIGPPPEAIRLMGDKAAAKRRMIEAGVPCVPGYQGDEQSDIKFAAEAERIGFPVMVKAAAGGGGRGLRLVETADALPAALGAARSEARNAFGSDVLILEKALAEPRHVEIQILADEEGNTVHLGERDCSVQRRHQKVIEETPSPAVDEALRREIGAAAVAAARAVGYVGAGTVEFLLDGEGDFYFLEMNTRLQVEHPVTEMVAGLDLVEWQLRIAAGESLPFGQEDVRLDGHAIEARLYAEDPAAGFLPQSGPVLQWRPAAGEGVRVDHGIVEGVGVTPFYDAMLAKFVAHGRDREQARRRLVAALRDSVLLGVNCNRRFLVEALEHPGFVSGQATTGFIAAHFPPDRLSPTRAEPPDIAVIAALRQQPENADAGTAHLMTHWHSSGPAERPLILDVNGETYALDIVWQGPAQCTVRDGEGTVRVRLLDRRDGAMRVEVDGVQTTAHFATDGDVLHVQLPGGSFACRDITAGETAAAGTGSGRLEAPMAGRILAVHAGPGDSVRKGQPLVVLEAMKMEHEVTAGRDGTVEEVAVKVGDQVTARQVLVNLTPAE